MDYYISSGITSTGITLSYGNMHISSGGTANSTTVEYRGSMYISSGGTANSTTVNDGGYMYVSSGGTAVEIIENGGYVYMANGVNVMFASNTINGLTLSNADMTVHSNTVANSTTVNFYGRMYISSGGVANSTTVNSNGGMSIYSGGVADTTTVNSWGSMYISSGGVANSTTVNSGWMSISSGGVANSTTVNSGGSMYIASGGTATDIVASAGARLGITVAPDTYIQGTYAGSAFEMKDAQITGYAVNSDGRMLISSGGVANSTTLNSSGWMFILSGGVANSTTVNFWGHMYISSGGVANSTTVDYGGFMYIEDGGVANSTTVNSGSGTGWGYMLISSGGVANSTTINSGIMYISSGGVANSTTVNSGGVMDIAGVANSTTVNSGGYMYIEDGGVHRGSLQIAAGAVVSASSGSVIDFTLTDRTMEDGYQINDLSRISGAPTYTITVSADQKAGEYKLAQGATNFTGSISIGDGTTQYGSITVNGDVFEYNSVKYTLTQSNGNLLLNIDSVTVPAVFIYSSGTLVSSAAEINNAIIVCGGNNSMHISSGGVANSTTVNSSGYMYISSGGVANSTTVNSSGRMNISSGGVANSTTINGYGGDMDIYYGGVANSTTINYRGSMSISSGGVANSTTVNEGWMYISSGGVANSTIVNSGGKMYIYSGGVANSTTVNSWGSMYISSGGVANSTVLSGYSAAMYISSGGVANSTTINSSWMNISSGGVANSTTVNSSGRMYIDFGGTATKIVENGGYVSVAYGANVTFASHTINGLTLSYTNMTVHSNTVANSTIVNSGGKMYIYSEGVANSTIVNSGGGMYIYSEGVANSTTVNSGGRMYISSGGTATKIVENGGYVSVAYGANVTFASHTINGLTLSYTNMTVHSNTVANSTIVNSGGSMYISSGGVANSTIVNSGGSMYISSGGVANSTTLNSGGDMYIFSGGTANSTTVNSRGRMYISSGGVHRGSLQIAAGATVSADAGAKIDFTVADRTVEDGYLINDLSRISGAPTYTITVSADQKAGEYKLAQGATNFTGTISIGDGTTQYGSITINGDIFEYNSVKYTLTQTSGNLLLMVDRGLVVSGGEPAVDVVVSSGGSMSVTSDGTASGTIIESTGNVTVSNGGTLVDTIVSSGGSMSVTSDGIASATVIESAGNVTVSSGGSTVDTMVSSGGSMHIANGGVHSGGLQIQSGATVSADDGARIDFTLDDRSANDGYLINDLSQISGTPSYTITVSADQDCGAYKLAQGAEEFTGTITIGDGTTTYGSLTVNGGILEYNDKLYELKNQDGDLTLSIYSTATPGGLTGSVNGVSWDSSGYVKEYVVQYSYDNFDTAISLSAPTTAVDTYNLPPESYLWQVKAFGGDWSDSGIIVGEDRQIQPQLVESDQDGDLDLFFASANGRWSASYAASHQGIKDIWGGTAEWVSLGGKNKLEDVFVGSTDANILVLTDDANGDALFVDDVYSAFPDELVAQSRIADIDEIRAGSGDDIVDLTSQQFVYIGDGVTVYGGLGNDVIWANSGANHLFGDAGNDRIVGGSDNDIIVGGAGNDRMHGGGGSDTFCFGSDWGIDTIEQLADGSVTLWFESGSEDFWNAETLTYSDGVNSVTIKGVLADAVTLKFGDAETAIAGAFDSFASEKIFEDQDKALIA